MDSAAVPAAMIGVGGFASQILQALGQCSAIRLVGVADRDAAAAAQAGQTAGVPSYTDNRSLLAQTRPKIVFLGTPPMAAGELVNACAERGIHVWKLLPLARNIGEGLAMIRRMEQAGLKLAVGTHRRFSAGYRRARQLRQRVGHVFLARAHYLFNWGPNLGWRGDLASAGGGALLDLGHHPVDLLVWTLGLPEEVYGSIAGGRKSAAAATPGGKLLPPYDTDDTAAALLRYRDGCVASMVTTRCSGPVSEEFSLHGQGGSIVANSEQCLLRDPDGNMLDRAVEDTEPLAVFRRQVEAFATAVIDNAATYECSARENLLNLATIEAIYLSNRTSQPENPLRLLKNHDLSVSDCLSCQRAQELDEITPISPP